MAHIEANRLRGYAQQEADAGGRTPIGAEAYLQESECEADCATTKSWKWTRREWIRYREESERCISGSSEVSYSRWCFRCSPYREYSRTARRATSRSSRT